MAEENFAEKMSSWVSCHVQIKRMLNAAGLGCKLESSSRVRSRTG
jgi:hypothetical protein